MIHMFITLFLSFCAYPFGYHVETAWLVSFFYMGREHAQAEHRVIQIYHDNKRINAPWYCGFEPRAWNRKSMMDLVDPLIVAVITLVI